MIKHYQIPIQNDSVHIAESGSPQNMPILFLHGWPENCYAFENILELAGKNFYALAIDLPGIGESNVNNPPAAKNDIAEYVRKIVNQIGLNKIILVGHDVGGQVAYSYLQNYPGELSAAVIMDVAIPGVEPWNEIINNPYIWHFNFHKIPGLPEKLIAGREREYFDYFYNILSFHPEKITQEARERYSKAYSDYVSLSTGFNWYRTFETDVKYNSEKIKKGQTNQVPLLYLRGDREAGKIEDYISGFEKAGISKIFHSIISDCGHFSPEEQPEQVWEAIHLFIRKIM